MNQPVMNPPAGSARDETFARIAAEGGHGSLVRPVAAEMPVAIEINGIGYAVLMATPADLIDLATGFLHADRLIGAAGDILEVTEIPVAQGLLLRVTISEMRLGAVVDRVRHRASESSCGLCGIETLEQALRPLPRVTAVTRADDGAVFAALAALRARQPLNRETGAVHAAASCSADGTIGLVREDVGRHNAFDKLVGAMMRGGAAWRDGFALLTSRCSYELVEKAVLSGCPMLATLSAPTTLAIDRARSAGLALRVLARPDAMLAIDP